MKKIHSFLFIAWVVSIACACGGAENKADPTPFDKSNPDTPDTIQKMPDEKAPDNTTVKSGTARGLSTEPSDILANIDSYLVSKPEYPPPAASGGIVNGMVVITNTLPDVTFQKAIAEVSILLPDGKEYRTDYYTVINIEPGGSKTVKIPNTTRGVTVLSHIVKVKSLELTNGEMVLVGNKYVPD